MQSAGEGLRKALERTSIRDARIPIYSNVTAAPVQKAEEIRKNLEQQLTNPVRWVESIERMISEGVSTFLEVGPGKVLQGLIKRINGHVQTTGVDTYEDLKKVAIA